MRLQEADTSGIVECMALSHRVFAALLVLGLSGVGMRAQEASPAIMPDEKQLPELHQLILDLDRNQKSVEAAAENYTYHIHRVVETLDGKGSVKKTETFDSESLTVQGVRVNRIVARDGKPLTAEEAKKEDERIDKDVLKAKEARAKAEKKARETDSRGDALITASRFLELGKFTNERREALNGRPTILVDYAGDPNAKTKNPGENMVRDLVGTVWIDEADRMMVRADGRFLNDFKLLGGLAIDIRKGTNFSFRSKKINGEAWLPEQIDGEGHARVLLVESFTGRMHMTASDYRKFHATSNIVGTNGVIGADGQPIPDAPAPPQPAANPKP
jgi:hypothetical protein